MIFLMPSNFLPKNNFQAMKVIMVTGDMMARQADLMLLKPVDIHELIYFVKRLMVDLVA